MPLIEELMTPEGEELLAHVTPYSPDRILPLTQSLRNQGYHPDLIALAFTQAQLRAQATTKFGPFAERMLFTRDGLEQATRLSVAVHHARRFTNAGITIMADITAGIGADSRLWSQRAPCPRSGKGPHDRAHRRTQRASFPRGPCDTR